VIVIVRPLTPTLWTIGVMKNSSPVSERIDGKSLLLPGAKDVLDKPADYHLTRGRAHV
jgi:hypothetical protein